MSHIVNSPENVESFQKKTNNRRDLIKQNAVEDYGSEESDSYSESDYSSSSAELEGGWNEEPMRAGELFYVEDSPVISEADKKKSPRQTSPVKNEPQESVAPKTVAPKTVALKSVVISVKAAASYGRKMATNLLASMLGIITLDIKPKGMSRSPTSDKIVVDVLVPGGATLRTGRVNLGDVLIAVNDVCVTLENVELVLRTISRPTNLKLTLQIEEQMHFPRGIPGSNSFLRKESVSSEKKEEVRECVVTLLTPNPNRIKRPDSLEGPNGVFYLTTVSSETAKVDDDILYSYPGTESSNLPSKLSSIRGVFVTLADIMKDTFSGQVLSSTIMLENNIVHCAYQILGTEVLIICVPASSYSLPQIHHTISNAIRLLNVMYGSIEVAFQPEHKNRLDHLFNLILMLNANTSDKQIMATNCKVPGIKTLTLSPELKSPVNAALAELESCDFDDGYNSQMYQRRLYTICGSCIFYDGHLLASHLSNGDLNDVYLFCYNHGLLDFSGKERIGQLLIWREVFRSADNTKPENKAYRIPTSRYFWMIIGLKHNLLCVLMQLNGKLFPASHTPRPDSLYVNQARATIISLANHYQESIDKRLVTTSCPHLASAQEFVEHNSKSIFKQSKPPTGSSSQSRGFKINFSSPLRAKNSDQNGSKLSPRVKAKNKFGSSTAKSLFRDKSFSSQGSDNSNNSIPQPEQPPTGKAFSLEDIRDAIDTVNPSSDQSVTNITSGSANLLFYYLNFDHAQGILIEPTQHDRDIVSGEMQEIIIGNFKKYSLLIHQRFCEKVEQDERCYEEGVSFHCVVPSYNSPSKKNAPFLRYWVVGRKICRPYNREVYVCFQNSASQNLVEICFKMAMCES